MSKPRVYAARVRPEYEIVFANRENELRLQKAAALKAIEHLDDAEYEPKKDAIEAEWLLQMTAANEAVRIAYEAAQV